MVSGHHSTNGLISYRKGEAVKRRASEILAGPSKTKQDNDSDFDSDATLEYAMTQVEFEEVEVKIPRNEITKNKFLFNKCNVTIINQ